MSFVCQGYIRPVSVEVLGESMFKKVAGLFFLMFMLSACSSKEDRLKETVIQQTTAAEQKLAVLAKRIESGDIRNAELIKQYAQWVSDNKPEFAQIAQQLARDASRKGPVFTGLESRLSDVKNSPGLFGSVVEQLEEAESIKEAASPSIFNDALSDPLNVLADFSDGVLPRVNAISREAEASANGSTNFGAGSQLVGNPSYGQWNTNSSGMSFWEWYGMYSLFNNMFSRPIYHDRWSRSRGYSYYNDYGRSRYTSPSRYKKQQAVENKTRKSYKSQGKSFKSAYAKKRTGASSLSRASNTPKRSSFSRSSSYSRSSSGTVRRGNVRTSRGARGGK